MSKEDAEQVELEGILDNLESEVQEKDDTPELSPEEKKAVAAGWRPKDEWDGDPDAWKDARTFNREGEMMSRIERQSKALERYKSRQSELEKSLSKLSEHHRKIAQIERQKALKELKQQKAEALKDEDYDSVVEFDDRISELKKEEETEKKEESKTSTTDEQAQEIVQEWLDDPVNDWYRKSRVLKSTADQVFVELVQKGKTVKEALAETEKEVRNEFEGTTFEKFFPNTSKKTGEAEEEGEEEEPQSKKRKPSKVADTSQKDAATGTRQKGTKRYTARHLSADELKFAKEFVDSGAVENVQEYVDQLAAVGHFDKN